MEKNSTSAPAPKTREQRHILKALKRLNRTLRNKLEGQHKQLRQAYYQAHKDDDGKVRCPVTGKRISYQNLSVDHYPIPFCALRDQWLQECGIELTPDLRLTTPQKLHWQAWHKRHAQLRLLDRETNKANGSYGWAVFEFPKRLYQ